MDEKQNNAVSKLLRDSHDDSALKDFETARANILTMLEAGTSSVEKLADLADRSQDAKVYRVLYEFIYHMAQSNKDLLEIQSKIRGLKDPELPQNMNAKTINQTVIFNGSTADLQRAIKTINIDENKENDE